MKTRPRVLIEDWLPAAAIGVECMRERGSSSALAPHTYLHVWWARRPLTASRAAVLGSLLPADFPHDVFEKLLGFGKSGEELVHIRGLMDSGNQVDGGFNCGRAFTNLVSERDLNSAYKEMENLWGDKVVIMDPMAGGGSIPLESTRLGIETIANEYNPVAMSVLEATVDYPFRWKDRLAAKTRDWSKQYISTCEERLSKYYPEIKHTRIWAYLFARTVPCPYTGYPAPLVPDWHLAKPKTGKRIAAQPIVDREKGTWKVDIKEVGRGAGQLSAIPRPTYSRGKGISLFTGQQISADYIKVMAQQGQMGSRLYAVVVKTPQGLEFRLPRPQDLEALEAAEKEFNRLRPGWEAQNIIPVEYYPEVSSDERPRLYGMPRWADLFAPRQLLAAGVMVEELRKLRPEIVKQEGEEMADAIEHLLAIVLDKFINYNSHLSSWHAPRVVMRSVFDRHDFAFKPTFAEMAPCHAGTGLEWAIDNTLDAYEKLASLPCHPDAQPVRLEQGSAAAMPWLEDKSVTAIVVDPPYADNVQYAELADFFYVWLKRTQGQRRPEWFMSELCEKDQEAVANPARFRQPDATSRRGAAGAARSLAREYYRQSMQAAFVEMHRVLRDDGVLTVMFTHKQQEEWESLFASLIEAGFMITATWPVKTESAHSLHQAKKNAAQSTVILVCRKRSEEAGVGYFNPAMRQEIQDAARQAAERLQREGLNRVDQLVGSFGPAMQVYSQYRQVRTDRGEVVDVGKAIDEAARAVSRWRIDELARHSLEGVEPEGQFYLLCWDVLGAAEFRFNEAKLLGNAVGMDIDRLVSAGLVSKTGDKINILSAQERRRERPLGAGEQVDPASSGRSRRVILKIHPGDIEFRTAIDACHALALAYLEAGGDRAGIGNARSLLLKQGWGHDSAVARLMEALLVAAPVALRRGTGPNSAAAKYPEFRAWHALIQPLFNIEPPDWSPPEFTGQPTLGGDFTEEDEDLEDESEE